MPSPLGPLGLELSGTIVTRVRIDPPRRDRAAYCSLNDLDGSDLLEEVCGRFAEYFAGARRKLEVDFDLCACGLEPFARRVLRETTKIPYGKTRTYRDVAEVAGRPEAYRQVLAVLCENPLPILVPCHRVVAHRNGIGSYVAGGERKLWLLKMEEDGLRED
jgi:methylated-DNA-[protein]-cysteine S-methyltransferase